MLSLLTPRPEITAAQIGLVLIDEVHLLSENRGAALEAGCLSRIRMVAQAPHMQHVRYATCQTIQNLAKLVTAFKEMSA